MATIWLVASTLSIAAAGAAHADAIPQRIVSLAPSLTEIVVALGLGDRLVGVSTHCDFPPEVRSIDKVGSYVAPAIERIVAKQPDIILAEPNVGNRQPVESLQQLGLDVLVVEVGSIAVTRASFLTVARRLGVEARGRALATRVDREIAATVARLGDAPRRRTLLVVSRKPLIAAGTGTLQDELIDLARGVNVGAEGGKGWPHLSLERVVAAAPEVVIDATMGQDTGASDAQAFWNGFASLPAVRAGRVVIYTGDTLLRSGPRIGVALAELAARIHPEVEPAGSR